mgnify:CR=1 FL=1|tara:strand:- start:178 stop:579 length:402 start_codon:yes stop_codon:yes gene_type:complete
METHTTGIGDLPIDNEMSDSSFPENSLRSTQNHVMDDNVHHEKVRFENNPTHINGQPNKSYDLTDIHKMIVLSTGMFILFNEPFIKDYLVNILNVILGKYFKEDKFGSVIYGLLFGVIMYVVTLVLDISSINI